MEPHHHFSHQHPLEFIEEHNVKSEKANCSGCGELVSRLSYSCTECEFYLDNKCFEASPELNLKSLLCQICHETHDLSPAYYCSACKFGLHVQCVSPAPTIKGEIHEHPFILFWRQVPFICDACGTSGDSISYICSPCGLIVHEKCIALQPIIKRFPRHGHQISHTFIHRKHEIKSWKCRICYEEVNSKHGCYCCSDCNYIVHANCAIKDYRWYTIIDYEIEETGELLNNSAFVVIKETKLGENIVIPTEIKHISHPHNLIFSDNVKGDCHRYCDGCMLFISTSFYHCSQCDFFIHNSCAELPKKMYMWTDTHQRPLTLYLHDVFRCRGCGFEFNNCFSYDCNVCGEQCLPCVLISDNSTCHGHDHCLFFYDEYEGQCNGCGRNLNDAYACKDCNFAVDYRCLRLPDKIQHKCDEHPLRLTYGEDNIYSEYHYCDVCEKGRNTSHWFYRCAICESSVHRDCVINAYSYMKLGKTYTTKDHPHPLTFTRKAYDYPSECHICEEHCEDLSAECLENGCNYIVHWKCIDPYK
ncbi:hypothetical protein ERO13_A10G214100v2 [Gossypium hirsutum]|nr:hypothetical protein ERO13_A10G214100v2 [Gossypium hirsutum]